VAFDGKDLKFTSKSEILIPESAQDLIKEHKNGLFFAITSVIEKEIIVKITFKGLPQNKAVYGRNADTLVHPHDFDKFLNIKIWIPKRLKEKLGKATDDIKSPRSFRRNRSRSPSP
jgi:hypothetical protein